MSKISPLSGFPELLPAQRAVEREVIASVSRTFELHGFANIETRAVEPLDQLLRKGDTSKEVYVLRRLQEDDASKDKGASKDKSRQRSSSDNVEGEAPLKMDLKNRRSRAYHAALSKASADGFSPENRYGADSALVFLKSAKGGGPFIANSCVSVVFDEKAKVFVAKRFYAVECSY